MGDLAKRKQMREEGVRRMRAMEFGQAITNVCAGERNPQRHAYFVALDIRSHKNRSGIVHKDYMAKCTDRKGRFWSTDVEVLFPGHLGMEECERLFAPIHAAMYG